MRLRIARKMDTKRLRGRDRRPWWSVYSDHQLAHAEHKLRKRWSRSNPTLDDGGRLTSPDWFMANRIHARLVRQIALRSIKMQAALDALRESALALTR